METIKCSHCGEYYSVTYKRCPFCDERAEEYLPPARRKNAGGKRLASNTKGGGYGRPRSQFMRVFALLLSLVLIIAAICIVISVGKTLFSSSGSDDPSDPPASVGDPSEPADIPDPADPNAPAPADPAAPADPSTPADLPTSLPAATLATDFSLSSTDITMFTAGEKAQLTARLIPEGASGELTWASSKPAVATVSASGLVTAVASGTANVTATMGGVSKTCIVRCNFKAPASPAGTPSAPAAVLTLNRSDFTLLSAGETFTLVASGASGSVTWSIGNSAVATIDQNGKVTAVGNGFTTVTASSSGAKATCVVRVAIA